MLLNDASPQVNHRKDIQISSGRSQGRTVYGGLVAGLLMQNALDVVANPHQQVLSCSVTFVGPVKEGAAQLTAEILRKGKSVTTIEVRLWQAGAVQSIFWQVLASRVRLKLWCISYQKLPIICCRATLTNALRALNARMLSAV